MTSALILPAAFRTRIEAEARGSIPRECCGLIEGVRDGSAIHVYALHITNNLATAPDRFKIDPAEQFRLMHVLRGTGREIVGCYHSHPNGRAEPSARDLEYAAEEGFIWLIAAVSAASLAVQISAFVCRKRAFEPVVLSIA